MVNNEILEGKFQEIGDTLADDVINELIENKNFFRFNEILKQIELDDEIQIDFDSPRLIDFLKAAKFPEWASIQRIQNAQRIFARYGIPSVLCLFCKVLPGGYGVKRASVALTITGAMQSNSHRRIIETAQFLLNVMSPDSFEKKGKAMSSILKIRLIHAAARGFVIKNPKWQKEWGVPISQEDMAGVISAFAVDTINGLVSLGIEMSDSEKEDYAYIWSVIGEIIGVNPILRSKSFNEMEAYLSLYKERQWAYSKEGEILATGLIHFMGQNLPIFLKGMPEYFIDFFMGNEAASILGLHYKDKNKLNGPILKINRLVNKLRSSSAFLDKLIRRFTLIILDTLLLREVGDSPVEFSIPVSLRENWEMNPLYRRLPRVEFEKTINVKIIFDNECILGELINISLTGAKIRVQKFLITNRNAKIYHVGDKSENFLANSLAKYIHKKSDTNFEVGFEFKNPNRKNLQAIL